MCLFIAVVENLELEHCELGLLVRIWPRSLAVGYVPLKDIMGLWPFFFCCSVAWDMSGLLY